MVASFGLHDGYQLPRVPLDRLIENRARLDATMLNRIGGLVDGAVTELKWGDRRYQLATHRPNLWINGNGVVVVWTDGHFRGSSAPDAASAAGTFFSTSLPAESASASTTPPAICTGRCQVFTASHGCDGGSVRIRIHSQPSRNDRNITSAFIVLPSRSAPRRQA